jgi:hypothetical protein
LRSNELQTEFRPWHGHINGFSPQAGNAFTLLAGGTISGKFSSIQLPILAGSLQWDTSKLYANGVLAATLSGDFNGNGTVDAADYIVWRKGLGTTYTQNDYNIWRTHFGETFGSGAALLSAEPLSAAVPEPATLVILLVGALTLCIRRVNRQFHKLITV